MKGEKMKKIGLDFDGVIFDSNQLKSKLIKYHFDLDVDSKLCRRKILVGGGLIKSEQYEFIKEKIHTERKTGLLLREVKNSLFYIRKLVEEGNEVKVITSRSDRSAEIARELLNINGFDLEVINVGVKGQKGPAARGLDVFVDDDFFKLRSLVNVVRNLFLFCQKRHEKKYVEKISKKIFSWHQLYKEIQFL